MKKDNKCNKEELNDLLAHPSKNIVIITHINPDGDAMGSSLALFHLLKNAGHNPCVVTPNPYPEFLQWLPGNDEVLISVKNFTTIAGKIEEAQIIFGIDFNDLGRIKKLGEIVMNSQAFKVIIDHHPSPEPCADCIITDIDVSSTAELLLNFFENNNLQKFINKDIAVCIFTGIMSDTGCFSYNSSGRDTYLAVAKLLDYGFDKDEIYYKLYDNFSVERMRLLGYSLNEKMEVFPEYNTAMISLTQEELRKYNFHPGDSENFVNYPLSIKNIRFSALFIEKKDHVKASFRSKGNFAVNEFSKKHFNGGGHLNAAGGESFMPMDETLRLFRELLPKYSKELLKYEI